MKYIKPWSKTDSMRWLDERSAECVPHWHTATTTKAFGSWLRANFMKAFDPIHDRIAKATSKNRDSLTIKFVIKGIK
jgi:hypothetical protein